MPTTTLLLNALDDAKVTGFIGPQTEAEFVREYTAQRLHRLARKLLRNETATVAQWDEAYSLISKAAAVLDATLA